ncbi:hypothetical protein C8J56DRAFT_479983 [Mycena floridula]|nr:hypothetical protein C8J56DRAFT_479983 [Mycena floridula]
MSSRRSAANGCRTARRGLEDGSQSLSFLPFAHIGRLVTRADSLQLKSCSTSTTMVACNYCPNNPRSRLPVFWPLRMKLCQDCWDKVEVAWRALSSKPHSKEAVVSFLRGVSLIRAFLSAYLHLGQVIQTYSDGITAVNWDVVEKSFRRSTICDEKDRN